MAMESLGGNMPAGRPAAVFAGGKTHVFAIGAGGSTMNHWTSANGIDWQGPNILPPNSVKLEKSYACAIAIGAYINVFAIGFGGPFTSGGPLVRWFSPDGTNFFPSLGDMDRNWPIPGGENGIAATYANSQIDAFAVTRQGIVRQSWNTASSPAGARMGSVILPNSGGLPPCVPAALSSAPNVIDVFVVGADFNAWRWRTSDFRNWQWSMLPRTDGAPAGPLVRSGFAAVSPAAGQIELFAVGSDGYIINWSFDGWTTRVNRLSTPGLHPGSVPAAIMVNGHIEVFVIGQPPNPFSGGPLFRFQRGLGGSWSVAVIDANLAAGGLGAAAGANRVDAFGFNSGANNSLLHWPAGITAASKEPWENWARNRAVRNPMAHCHPSTLEEVVSIVKTAEKTPGARVRAVGSSWSFSDIAETPSVIVETNEINRLIGHVIDKSVLTDQAPDPKYLIHVGAGIKVEDLMLTLDGMNLAPFTMGGSSGQTLAGVISTSVHGSNWDRGPIPNAVRAIHLVGPGGIQHWIEPDQWRITNEVPLRARLGPEVQIHYDDDWFDSVLVSMGSMGIITSVVLEVTDQYILERSCKELKWSELNPQLALGTLFADPDQYVMVAIDPVERGDRTCYVTTHRRSAGSPTGPGGAFDPLAAYCQLDVEKALKYLGTLSLATPVIEAIMSVITATAGAFGIPLPAGATLAVAIPIIVAALKAAGPGSVGDFFGSLFNQSSEAAAAIASWLTRDVLKPGQTFRDVAHKIMAPANPGECAARGLGLEMAFDTSSGEYLKFVDKAMMLLDQRRLEGMVLGGWFSLRFVGPSRAILSPQQSARTCMIEFVGLRSMNSTATLLDQLEKLGAEHHAIQHWGMFSVPNLGESDIKRAYPRLDTWRRVRREISGGGTIHTFENAFSARVGLDAAPSGAPLVWQQEWRWCRKCLGMAFAGGAPGPCPAGDTHDHSASGNYGFAYNNPSAPGQRNWRWCSKCMGMTFGGAAPAPCPAGGTHDLSSSGEYTILRNGQSNWRWCNKCQCLAFGGAATPGPCPAGGAHDHSGSGNYWLASAPTVEVELPPRRPGLPTKRVRVEQSHSSPEIPGQRGWRWCNRCQGLSREGGRCVGAAPHSHDGSGNYVVPLNAPTAPGQAHWRLCKKCQTLSFRAGVCFAGGSHDYAGSGDYIVRGNSGQNEWRHCKNCQGLWFSGNGGQGKCPAPAGVHDLGTDDFFV